MAARALAQYLMPSLFFNRFPDLPAAQAPQPKPQSVDLSRTDDVNIRLPEDAEPEALPEADDRGFAPAAPFVPPADEKPGFAIIDQREADGVPIFVDLYARGDDTGELIDALLDEIRVFAQTASTPEQLVALYTKNGAAMQFLKDLGDEQDRTDLKTILDTRKRQLEIAAEHALGKPAPGAAGVTQPRRERTRARG